jgi:hypothetical protein
MDAWRQADVLLKRDGHGGLPLEGCPRPWKSLVYEKAIMLGAELIAP